MPIRRPLMGGRRFLPSVLMALAVLLAVAMACLTSAAAGQAADKPAACAMPAPGGPPPNSPTTITTIEQAYYCIFSNYYGGSTLADEGLLTGAFAGLTNELARLGRDQAAATMPALTGDRDSDWAAFSAVYQQVISRLPDGAALRQALAAAAMNGMLTSLHDNHVRWQYSQQPPGGVPGDAYGLGITTSPTGPLTVSAPQEALAPLYVTSVAPGSPSASDGLRSGDVIVSVNGAPPFADGIVSQGVMSLLFPQYPQGKRLQLRLRRPATGRTWTVAIQPALYTAPTLAVSATRLPSGIAYVKVPAFFQGAADQARQAVSDMESSAALHGLVLDLRGNGGGSPAEVSRLLSAFVHGKPLNYECNPSGHCLSSAPDDSIPLLHLPLVVLTDRNCASACDSFSAAVKDLQLGTLVGTRTAGIVSGPAGGYQLDDGSLLIMPSTHELGAGHEIVNGIGVAPDYNIPLTAEDVSTGHDPGLSKALALLGH